MRNRRWIVKWLIYSFFAVLCMLLQCAFFDRIIILGVHPAVMPVLVALVATLEGTAGGAFFGLFAGLLCDYAVHPSEGFYAIALMLFGASAGWLCDNVFRKRFLISAAMSLAGLVITSVFYFLIYFASGGKAGPSALFLVTLPEALLSMPFVLLYFPVRAFSRIINRGNSLLS